METLSSSLLTKIINRPTHTILRNDNKTLNEQLLSISVVIRNLDPKIIPKNFDGRKVWKGLITPVMNQGTCGSCWAFASTSVLGERFNIQSMGKINIQLSATKLILCDWKGAEVELELNNRLLNISAEKNLVALNNTACFGNTLLDTCRYLYQIGTNTEDCIPYNKNLGTLGEYQTLGSFSSVKDLPFCQTISGEDGDMCDDNDFMARSGIEIGTPARFYKALHFYSVPGIGDIGEINIRKEIYNWGPVLTGMKVHSDFYTFDPKTQIYQWDKKSPQVGGHAIELIGWGEENGKKYWIIKNSWGVEWGIDGYFKMIRGVNDCEIENNCMAMVPDFFFPLGYKTLQPVEIKEKGNILYDKEKIIINSKNVIAGGIDVETGYSKRVLSYYPFLDKTKLISLKDIPSWDTFIAGRDASYENHNNYSLSKKSIKQVVYKIFITVLIIFILILITFIIKLNSKLNSKLR